LSILSESLKKFYTTKIEECQRNDGEQRAHYKCAEKLQTIAHANSNVLEVPVDHNQ